MLNLTDGPKKEDEGTGRNSIRGRKVILHQPKGTANIANKDLNYLLANQTKRAEENDKET